MEKTSDHRVKLLLIGDSAVGKSCLFFRFMEDVFDSCSNATVGIDFSIRTIEIDGKKIQLQIWDTGGAERYRSLTRAYYRSANGIMLVYDITDRKSFENISDWIHDIEEHAPADVEKIVLGNKCDMNDSRKVSMETGEQLTVEYGIKFLETSAKSGINVEEVVLTLIRNIVKRLNNKMSDCNSSSPSTCGTCRDSAFIPSPVVIGGGNT